MRATSCHSDSRANSLKSWILTRAISSLNSGGASVLAASAAPEASNCAARASMRRTRFSRSLYALAEAARGAPPQRFHAITMYVRAFQLCVAATERVKRSASMSSGANSPCRARALAASSTDWKLFRSAQEVSGNTAPVGALSGSAANCSGCAGSVAPASGRAGAASHSIFWRLFGVTGARDPPAAAPDDCCPCQR